MKRELIVAKIEKISDDRMRVKTKEGCVAWGYFPDELKTKNALAGDTIEFEALLVAKESRKTGYFIRPNKVRIVRRTKNK